MPLTAIDKFVDHGNQTVFGKGGVADGITEFSSPPFLVNGKHVQGRSGVMTPLASALGVFWENVSRHTDGFKKGYYFIGSGIVANLAYNNDEIQNERRDIHLIIIEWSTAKVAS